MASPPPDDLALTQGQMAKLSDAVCDLLREAILTKKLPPGSRIYPVELAARMSVSPTPVKDALQRLAGERLVEILPRRGIVVTQPSVATVNEVFAVRRVLECLAVEAAIDRDCPAAEWAGEIRRLRLLADRVAGAGRDGDAGGQVAANAAFHEGLIHLAKNATLAEVYGQIQSRILLARLRANLSGWQDRLRQDNLEHLGIVACLEARDGAGAVAAVAAHVRGAQRRAVGDAVHQGWSADGS